MTLTQEAIERIYWANERGIKVDYTPQEIADIVYEQEIITFCSRNGSVSFDVDDLVEV
jgi:transcriptional regulator